MRYRRLSYRYEIVVTPNIAWPPASPWQASALRGALGWRPPTDVFESPDALTVVTELAGVDPEAIDAILYQDALVVEGERKLPCCGDDGVYQAAEIRQGKFRIELPLAAPIDADRVESRYDRGLLVIRLPKLETR